jgi:hypothetical protein
MDARTPQKPLAEEEIDWPNIPFHPEAEKYNKVDAHALDGLAADIAEQGILNKMPIAFEPGTKVVWCFDGQNRRAAAEKIGYRLGSKDYQWVPWPKDVAKYVRSLNVHRRHLDKDDRERQIKEEIRNNPETSTTVLAKRFGFDPKTVRKYKDDVDKELPTFLEIWEALPNQIKTAFVRDQRCILLGLLGS